jgi:TatD DNase family protein
MYDAHNHLQDERLRMELPTIVQQLEGLPVCKAVVNGTRPEDWGAVAQLAREYEWVVPSYGLHPWYVNQNCESRLSELGSYLKNPGASVGEIGLDRWIKGYDIEQQERAFVLQLKLARKLGRPVTIHCLKAWGRLLEILREEDLPCGFLLHSYGGPAEMVPIFVQLGGYFSLSGYFAHERKRRQCEVFRTVPLDRLLLETDSPDMALPPGLEAFHFRTEREKNLNHPGNIQAVYGFASSLYDIPLEELANIIESNFHRFFEPVLPHLGVTSG